MEISISQSSLRLPATIPQRYKASSNFNRLSIPIKPTKFSNFPSKFYTNKLNLPVGPYGENKVTKSLLSGQTKRDSIQVCAQVGSTGSAPMLAKAQADVAGPDSVYAKVVRFGYACYKFMLPYSMSGAIITAICLFARVLVENPQLFKWSLLLKSFPGLIVVIFAHTYNNGLNQVFDVDIDRVNKPYLPIPSGELSMKQAQLVLTFAVLGGFLILRFMNADLITTSLYCFGLLVGTSYSVPPFRFKESSIATAIVIPLISFITTIGVLYAARASLGVLSFFWSPPTVFITTFTTLFFVVICMIKDIPDVEGDMMHNIQTFAARFGAKNVAATGVGMLLINYIGAIAAAIYLPQAFKRYIMLPAHAILALMLLFQARKLDKANYAKDASTSFYRFLWRLLLWELLLFPFI